MWDCQIENPGIRLETWWFGFTKILSFSEDVEGYKTEPRFFAMDRREIDFVVIKQKPLFAVECKHGEKAASPHLFYFKERTSIPHFYQVHMGSSHRQLDDRISLLPFERFCQDVGLA